MRTLSGLPAAILFLLLFSLPLPAQLWRDVGPYGATILRLHLDSNGTLYAESPSTVYRRPDGAAEWERVPFFDSIPRLRDGSNMAVVHDGILAFDSCCAVWWSGDGEEWEKRSELPDIGEISPSVVQIGDTIYMLRQDAQTALYTSADNGHTWSVLDTVGSVTTGLATDGTDLYRFDLQGLVRREQEGWRVLTSEISPGGNAAWFSGDTIVYQTLRAYDNTYISIDAGESWQPVSAPGLRVVEMHDGLLWAVSNAGDGIYTRPTFGSEWKLAVSYAGLPESSLTLLIEEGKHYVGTRIGVLGWTPPENRLFLDVEGMSGLSVSHLIEGNNEMIAVTSAGIYRRNFDSSEWRRDNRPELRPITDIIYDGTMIAVNGRSHHAWIFNEESREWERLGPESESLPVHSVYADGQLIVLGARNRIYRSTNRGRNWDVQEVNAGGEIFELVGRDNGILGFVGRGGLHIVASYDSGVTWRTDLPPLPTLSEDAVVHLGGPLYLGTQDSGLYWSLDFGSTWASRNPTGQPASRYSVHAGAIGESENIPWVYGFPKGSADPLESGMICGSLYPYSDWWSCREVPSTTRITVILGRGPFVFAGTDRESVKSIGYFLGVDEEKPPISQIQISWVESSGSLHVRTDRLVGYVVFLLDSRGARITSAIEGRVDVGKAVIPLPTADLPSGMYYAAVMIDGQKMSLVPVPIVR